MNRYLEKMTSPDVSGTSRAHGQSLFALSGFSTRSPVTECQKCQKRPGRTFGTFGTARPGAHIHGAACRAGWQPTAITDRSWPSGADLALDVQ